MSFSHRKRAQKSIHETYRLLGLAGTGQYGRVYCARHQITGELVALKELEAHRFPTQNLLRELRYLLALNHPNITRCFALEHAREGRYLVLEYCEGGTLRDLLNQSVPLPYSQILQFMHDILAGLEHAHAQGLVHCDIKPENILLKPTPTGWSLKLTDFGIARHQERSTPDLSATGSPAYMAPERFYGQVEPATDLYAVGIILYELLAGRRPFSGTPAHLMHAHLNQPPLLFPDIPTPFCPIVEIALRKLAARRFRTAPAMAEALSHLAPTLLEPDHCWLGLNPPLLPAPDLQKHPIPPLDSWLALPPSGSHSPHLFWSAGATITHTHSFPTHALGDPSPPSLPPLPSSVTHLYSLPDPPQQQQGDPSVFSLLVMTAEAAYRLTPPHPAKALLHPAQAWHHAYHPYHHWLAWATLTEWGLIHLKPPLPPANEAPHLAENWRDLNWSESYRYDRWLLPQSGLVEAPQLMWLPSALVCVIEQRVYFYPYQNVIPPQPNSPEIYDLPLPARQWVQGSPLPNLLMTDDQHPHRLTLIQFHPFRVKYLFLQADIDQMMAAPWGFVVYTRYHRLVLLTAQGDPLAQIQLPMAARLLQVSSNGEVWLQSQDPVEEGGLYHLLRMDFRQLSLLDEQGSPAKIINLSYT
ncbi:MAG: serine/threonine-protein kinase [Cyanobacteriota bacterium]|nr:serine/threonine-protein kinase [Cyanobacteriota bacterium]